MAGQEGLWLVLKCDCSVTLFPFLSLQYNDFTEDVFEIFETCGRVKYWEEDKYLTKVNKTGLGKVVIRFYVCLKECLCISFACSFIASISNWLGTPNNKYLTLYNNKWNFDLCRSCFNHRAILYSVWENRKK